MRQGIICLIFFYAISMGYKEKMGAKKKSIRI